MKEKSLLIATLCLALLGTACDDKVDKIGPKGDIPATAITDLTYTSEEDRDQHEASITIAFDYDKEAPGSDLLYVRAAYFDPYLGKEVSRVGSAIDGHGTVILPKTFAVAGTYSVTLTPMSSSDREGTPSTIDVKSVPIQKFVKGYPTDNKLKIVDMTTNAQEPWEGPIANAFDGNVNTFFHSIYSGSVPEPHYVVAELEEPQEAFQVKFVTRGNGNGETNVQESDIRVSADGETWSAPIHEAYSVERETGKEVAGKVQLTDRSFKYLRFTPTKTAGGTPFFTLAEFEIYQVDLVVTDYEAEAKKVIDAHGAAK